MSTTEKPEVQSPEEFERHQIQEEIGHRVYTDDITSTKNLLNEVKVLYCNS